MPPSPKEPPRCSRGGRRWRAGDASRDRVAGERRVRAGIFSVRGRGRRRAPLWSLERQHRPGLGASGRAGSPGTLWQEQETGSCRSPGSSCPAALGTGARFGFCSGTRQAACGSAQAPGPAEQLSAGALDREPRAAGLPPTSAMARPHCPEPGAGGANDTPGLMSQKTLAEAQARFVGILHQRG